MTFAALNGQRIIGGSVMIPFYGTWVADITLAVSSPLPVNVTLQIGDLSLLGFIYRSASFTASRSARVVGGYGGWRKTVPAQAYYSAYGVTMSMVLRDVAAIVGEKVNVQQDQNLGNIFIRESAQASRFLRLLTGPEWYLDATGVTQVGPRPTNTVSSPFTVIDWSGGKGRFDVATENYAAWQPGAVFQNSNISVPQTVGMTNISLENDGKVRLVVLSAGNADV